MFFIPVSVADVGNDIRFSPSPFSMRANFSTVVGTLDWCRFANQNTVFVNVFSENSKVEITYFSLFSFVGNML